MDLPPPDESDDPYMDPTSDLYERLRKWVVHGIKRVLKRPCTISLKVSLEKFNSHPPKEIRDRLEEGVMTLCVSWVTKRKSLLENLSMVFPPISGVSRVLCEVPLDYTVLIEA